MKGNGGKPGGVMPLARLGSFSATLSSEGGAVTAEEVRRLPKDVSVSFRAAPELRRALEAAGDQFTGETTELATP